MQSLPSTNGYTCTCHNPLTRSIELNHHFFLQSSKSFGSVPMSPLPPACPPMRRYSRQASTSSAASSVRNAVYADPDLEESLHATLRPSASMGTMSHLNATKPSRARASTIPNKQSAERSSTPRETSAYCALDDKTGPVASSSLSRRCFPLGQLDVSQSSPLEYESAGQQFPGAVPHNPDYFSPPTTPTTSANRYSSDAPSEPPLTPSFSAFRMHTGPSSRASTPDTSPQSTWSRADGRKALNSIDQVQEECVWERNSSRWSIASSIEVERVRPMSKRIFGHSVDALSSFAPVSTGQSNKTSHEATLRRLEGLPTAPINGSFDHEQLPRTPRKRTRLRSFMSRLSHLPSPMPHANVSPPPPTPVLFSKANAAANQEPQPVAHNESLVDTDPFRAPGMSFSDPASEPSDFPHTHDSPPAKRLNGRSRVRSLFFQS